MSPRVGGLQEPGVRAEAGARTELTSFIKTRQLMLEKLLLSLFKQKDGPE